MCSMPDGEGEAVICDMLHDHFDHASVWQQMQKIASEATVPYIIRGFFEINKQSTGF